MKTKQTILVALALLVSTITFAQVGIGTPTPHGSSILDLESTTKGFLPPRMTDAQRDAIGTPPKGLIIYNTTEKCLQWHNGSSWFSGCSGAVVAEPPVGETPGLLPANIVLNAISPYFIASVFDTDYLSFTTPTASAQLPGTPADDNADGTSEAVTLDVLGTLSTTGVTIKIPYTVTVATVALPAFSQTITIPAAFTNNNTATAITFEYAAQSLAVGSGLIDATLKATTATLEAIKLDLNSGLGNDYLGWLLGTFTYALDNAGGTAGFQVRDIPGIPDKKIGQTINGVTYNYLYLPVTSASGKLWLNNNLGAVYSTIGDTDFNVTQQATAFNDFKAYGNLYQWGRASDGHDLVERTSSTTGILINGITNTKANVPVNALFITASSNPYDWRVNQEATLWATEAATNNPCPHGWRVPTIDELDAERALFITQNQLGAINSVLKLPSAGRTSRTNGTLGSQATSGNYWSSTVSGTNASNLFFTSSAATTPSTLRANGFSVRCLKD